MPYARILACAAFAAMTAAPAFAQEVERYRLERDGDAYIRLDTETGRMALCREREGQLVCRMAAEEREAYDRQFDALHDRIKELEERVATLESGRPAAGLPGEEEFEQTLGYMERFLRRFMGVVKDLEREFGGSEPEPEADRT